MEQNTLNLIQAIIDKKPSEAATFFNDAIQEKLSDRIEELKSQLSLNDNNLNIEEETLNEKHEVIDTYTPTRNDDHFKGDRYELRHNDDKWHSIVKTHQGGKSTQNKWGGYDTSNNGTPKYIAKKWKELKAHYNNPNVRSANFSLNNKDSNK